MKKKSGGKYKARFPKPIVTIVILLLYISSFGCKKNLVTSHKGDDAMIEQLLRKMTIDEKIGQMTQICFSSITLNGNKELLLNDSLIREAILTYHVGSFISGTGTLSEWYDFISKIQKIAVKESRLGIPLMIGIDHVHGANYINEGTILPHNITLSCSFDTVAVRMAAKITREETLPSGISLNFAPVLDLGVNSYWPRFYETFGEDPLLASQMGKVFIEEFQKKDPVTKISLSATAKHFIGYSDPASGFDRSPSYIPMQPLYELHVPAFRAGVQAGVRAIMINSGELNGYPVHASAPIISGLLRQKLGFNGVIITDIKDIDKLIELHHLARNRKEAVKLALDAGIDINMACTTFEFAYWIKELIREGSISENRIDESVRRILRMKYEMGLFEHPYPASVKDTDLYIKNHTYAIDLASESIVLLKNQDVLP
ncbi:MAG: glycoside hydrolase family 3 protein, partial [Bacteroidales bacterium]